jgi:hypothetical protein
MLGTSPIITTDVRRIASQSDVWESVWGRYIARGIAASGTLSGSYACARSRFAPPLLDAPTVDYDYFWNFNRRCDADNATVREAPAYDCIYTRFSILYV